MSAYTCPNGHASTEGDFCDTCGSPIEGAAPAAVVTTAAPAAAEPAAPAGDCPQCRAPRGPGRFCEDCGYDYTTGRVPQLGTPTPAAPAGEWTATVFADPDYFADNDIEGVEFPAGAPRRTVRLAPPQVRIGRHSSSKGTTPEIDLAQAPADPGASHNHALLTFSVDGTWLVSDLGSTNGTYLNEEARPLDPGQTRALKDGDRVHVGAWTTITLHAP
ncbi:FHA domain-containing protein [Actinoplanes flavus]|uniref:FHA domain-containing protein n=1 Tax=Actinoplanes flavus TaxID=2820290 RepID=A0ABS3UKV4_9ACTN|nr:FHA domain-containing protein [Actinoplanes flavus]MBO3739061.1 FHA domain-containing protein [Actinoplanes flavus]